MAVVCYSWDDAPYKWIETPFTWAEGCVIEKIVGGYGAIPRQKVIERLTNLSDDEKEVKPIIINPRGKRSRGRGKKIL